MRTLLVVSRLPVTGRRGNEVRTAQWLGVLDGAGVVAPSPSRSLGDGGRGRWLYRRPVLASGLRAAAWAAAGLPAQEGLYAGGAAREALERALADGPWDLVVVQLVRSAWALDVLARRAPDVPVLYDAIDSMALHFRRAASRARPPSSWALRGEAERCARRERELVERAALVTAVARRDLEALGDLRGKSRLVPIGVAAPDPPRPPAGPPTVLLSGNLGYRPTADAALRFASEVWPRLRRLVPDARWLLVGARPPRRLRALGSIPGVEVHGDVADLAPFLDRATVSIAPMATGSGVPIKVLEAWAAERPAVAHPWAAAGLEEDPARGVAVAERSQEWVETLARLLTDPAAAAALAERGRAVWARHYRPEAVKAAILDAVAAARARAPE